MSMFEFHVEILNHIIILNHDHANLLVTFWTQIIHDLKCLVDEVSGDYLANVLEVLKSGSSEVRDLVKQSILQGGNSLKVLQPVVLNSIVEIIVEKSVEVSSSLNFHLQTPSSVFFLLLSLKA